MVGMGAVVVAAVDGKDVGRAVGIADEVADILHILLRIHPAVEGRIDRRMVVAAAAGSHHILADLRMDIGCIVAVVGVGRLVVGVGPVDCWAPSRGPVQR